MLKKETVLIVGAGASCEARLPSGKELKDHISKSLGLEFQRFGELVKGDEDIVRSLRQHEKEKGHGSTTSLVEAARLIAEAMPLAPSIDNFIDAHNGNEEIEICGKLAIASAILRAEKASTLYADLSFTDSHPKFSDLEPTWFTKLLQALTTDVRKSSLRTLFGNISIVTFNYDRCIEHFLFHGLQTLYGINPNSAAEALKSLRIYHPYGQVGHLPWQNGTSNIPFGTPTTHLDLLPVATQLRTFTERLEDSDSLREMRRAVAEAKQVIFLGFAFHEQNMRLLLPGTETRADRVLGTVTQPPEIRP